MLFINRSGDVTLLSLLERSVLCPPSGILNRKQFFNNYICIHPQTGVGAAAELGACGTTDRSYFLKKVRIYRIQIENQGLETMEQF
jgi:hypothetical protein